MKQTMFSAGRLFAVGLDTGPEEFALLQNVNIDFTRDPKELWGEREFSEVIANGMTRIAGRCSQGRVFGSLYANAFFRETVTAGSVGFADHEAQTIPGSGYFTIDVDNAADWTDDLGVYFTVTGDRLTYNANGPAAAGEYSVVAGTYTFHSADAGNAVKIDYLYDSTDGKMFTINNQLMGTAPSFKMVLFNPGRTRTGAAPFVFVLNSVIPTKFSLPFRMSEFALPEFDFIGSADESDVIGLMSTMV